MAVYDGFFDAVLDEETGKYDRAYGSGDFTKYFDKIIGSGVCIHDAPDSYRAEFEDGTLWLRPGYLFIQGYWLANVPGPEEDPATYKGYAVALPAGQTGPLAVVAHLDLGKRMIELEVRSVAQAYPDALVLAIVTPTAVEDTRYNTDLCGVIDTAGELSNKVLWAVNYIDNEIESKLARVERDIAVQEAKLDAKIAEVQAVADRISPPPVGAIQFSASQNVGAEWLPCDGRFVNEADYPELVAALGKLTPQADDFTALLHTTVSEQVSNHVYRDGTVWIYLVKSKKLVGVSDTSTKEISVIGADLITEVPGADVVLSICGGSLYLAQNNYSYPTFVLLECAEFEDALTQISMVRLTTTVVYGGGNSIAYPSVTDIQGEKHIALGKTGDCNFSVAVWDAGDLNSFTTRTLGISSQTKWEKFSSIFAFSEKNSNEMLLASMNGVDLSPYGSFQFGIGSFVQCIYGDHTVYVSAEDSVYAKLMKKFSGIDIGLPQNIIPIAGNNEYLWCIELENKNAVIYYGKYNPKTAFDWETIPLALPSRARLFKESVVYNGAQGIWFIFVGTGLLFSESLTSGTWGYLDTTAFIGMITQFGCLTCDVSNNVLYISGMDTTGLPVVYKFALPNLYDYANDGAWLPMIASDGVPAYIKAYEPKEAET